MKVVVTAQGTTLDSPVDPRFGRAATFLLVDTETLEAVAHENTAAGEPQGAGTQAARAVIMLGPQAVITGHVGPRAFAVFQAAGIPIFLAERGTVREAIAAFKAGQLALADHPNV
ncbi:MAG: NifB/NifX family molybdenum-iron cluster-binding protein [Thermogutta sp.]|nr:NifB/NifX family molybdenum-iron cluster-binding protein [Thermogutta sp.]HPU05907.1 NifB/NifX family molybdenum-iron cluster-binding protein [Thermogutta sp.]HQF14362.1 NifB/NifX family molybdenum-iron cluster-binding protein [Thermogutta sp.]